MVRVIQKPARDHLFIDVNPQFDGKYMSQWHFIQSYLHASNAAEGAAQDIEEAMCVLPHELVLMSYTELIRTTFDIKIVPAINNVSAERDSLVAIVQNLSDGLLRYEACFARLQITIGEITSPFQALVREQLDRQKWREAFRKWIVWALSQENESLLLDMHARIKHVGLSSFFENELSTILDTCMLGSSSQALAKSWDESHLDTLLQETVEAPQKLLHLLEMSIETDLLESLARLRLASLRIAELFDIIIDFPASAPALEDLKRCLDSTKARSDLVKAYQQQLDTRLLHPGANTPDIITVYISTIKAFLLLDPPGVLLDKVARPIRKYLRERTDTIRCIISSLLGEVDGSLADELSEQRLPDDVDDQDDPDWLPDPIDAAPDYAKNRASDIIGSLISIYENKDVFVRELQTLLSDRLLAVTDYNIDQELRNLEMLKVRFGDGMLSVCDVMLKDMSDSRRIDAQVHESDTDAETATTLPDAVLHTTILSRLYWPAMKSSVYRPAILADSNTSNPDDLHNNEKQLASDSTATESGLKLPQPILQMMAKYSSAFRHLKAQRSLHFLKDLGHVRVQLELDDREFDMLVTPAHAASIYLFQSPTESPELEVKLTLSEVSTHLGTSELETKRNLAFWQSQRILCVIDSQYQVLNRLPTTTSSSVSLTVHDPLTSSFPEQMAVFDEVMEEELDEMDQIWPFIVGMLTNVGNLPSDRIQSMLGMFSPGYDKSESQLKEYLVKKVRAGVIEIKGGEYRLSSGTAVGGI